VRWSDSMNAQDNNGMNLLETLSPVFLHYLFGEACGSVPDHVCPNSFSPDFWLHTVLEDFSRCCWK